MVERFERFSLTISEISRLWHKIAADEMEKYGLKGPHAIYLTTMYRLNEGVTAPRLCELCGKDKADVSRMMTMMEKKGLVRKEGEFRNRYRGVFLLTDAGRNAAEQVCSRASLAVELAGQELSDETREIFYSALESITEHLRRISREGLPESSEQ